MVLIGLVRIFRSYGAFFWWCVEGYRHPAPTELFSTGGAQRYRHLAPKTEPVLVQNITYSILQLLAIPTA